MQETKKESVVNQIYDLLKEQIITIRMVPGQLLLVQQLAQDLGVSRTPVREALIRLKEEGLVDEAGGHKFRVSAVTWDMIEKCYEARMIVEVGCIERAAKLASPDDINHLNSIVNEMEEAVKSQSYSTYFELDGIFHLAIVDILGNSIMSDFVKKNSNQQKRIRFCSRGISSNMTKSLEEHHKMIKAIESHDEKKAASVMVSHLNRSRDDLNSLREEQQIVPLILIK